MNMYGIVVSIFDFHRRDRGSNPGRGGEIFIMITTTLYCSTIDKCLKTICHRFTQAMREIGKMETVWKPVSG